MISLNDAQLQTVMTAAADLPHEKRSVFLQRCAAMLNMKGRGRFTNDDLQEVIGLAKTGLVREPNLGGCASP